MQQRRLRNDGHSSRLLAEKIIRELLAWCLALGDTRYAISGIGRICLLQASDMQDNKSSDIRRIANNVDYAVHPMPACRKGKGNAGVSYCPPSFYRELR